MSRARAGAAVRPPEGRRMRKRPDVLSVVVKALTEAVFQRQVKGVLEQLGFVVWTFPIMKRTVAGVPDLLFWSPMRPGRLYAWELKRERRAVISKAQAAAIKHLSTVAGIDARIVRPSEWPALRDRLLEGA